MLENLGLIHTDNNPALHRHNNAEDDELSNADKKN